MTSSVVIVGSGQAGFQLAASLRDNGFRGRVTLVGEEPQLPYQRPPLSKGFLDGDSDGAELAFRPAQFYEENEIDLRLGVRVERIDRAAQTVELLDGETIGYSHLVLATGVRNRSLPFAEAGLTGVVGLRTLHDADALRSRLREARDVVVVGGGFIGLEVAATAATAGARVTVLEIGGRLMSRVATPAMAAHFAQSHRAAGVEILFGTSATRLVAHGTRVGQVETSDGRAIAADLVVVGIGVDANDDLAAAAGLGVSNGVLVDEHLLTTDPNISAIGDCARFQHRFASHAVRLESVQNATDQARCVARRIAGAAAAYDAVPWFWTEQLGMRLQMAGLIDGHDVVVERGDRATGKFSVFCFRGERFVGAESVNSPADHMAARRLLESGAPLSPAQVADPEFDLKGYSRRPLAPADV